MQSSTSSNPFADRNGNGIPDSLEKQTFVTQVVLPTQVIEKPAAIHEEIRREQVEEIQPVINVEKLKTEVHQVTQPLVDREVRPVGVTERVLPTQVLPQVVQPNVGAPLPSDVSTVSYAQQQNRVVEKPAIFMETQKTQIIEEIQPVLYKEVVVPTLIKETKPIYQTVVEGTTYVQETLPVRELSGTQYRYPTQVVQQPMVQPVVQPVVQQPMVQPVVQPVVQQPVVSRDVPLAPPKPVITTETITTTTQTTTNSPYAPL